MTDLAQAPVPSRWNRYRLTVTLVMAAVFLFAIRRLFPVFIDRLAAGHLHAPDWALVERLPLIIKLHLIGALGALVVGVAIMSLVKGKAAHRTLGWIWMSLMSLAAGASLFITGLNGNHWSLIHLFTGWTLMVLPMAVIAARRHKVVNHRRMMTGLFYGGLVINLAIAFIPGRTMWNIFFG